jgi:hypothetical protein
MFANLDRQEFIRLLQKLGSESDADVLSAARDLHAKVTVAGVSWEALLAPDAVDEETEEEGIASTPSEEGEILSAPDPDHGALSDAEKAEAQSLIDAIGALKISEQTRADLADYQRDLVAGEFEQMDLRYLRGLAKRLKK